MKIMIQIRRSVFETNSSSSHSLSIPKESVLTNNDDIKLVQLEGVVTPFRNDEYDGVFMHISKEDIIGKLRYLYSAFLQNDRGNVYTFREIQKCVPNVVFQDTFEEYYYNVEDSECLFSNSSNIFSWVIPSHYNMKRFLLYGEVFVWNRDIPRINEENECHKLEDENNIYFTG